MTKNSFVVKVNFTCKPRKKLPCKMWGTLEIGVSVAIANDLDDLILILQEKGLQAVINKMKQKQMKQA